jgi:hypothetical protein
MDENWFSSDINAPIDDLHRDCLESVAMIRCKHAESRSKLGLDRPVEDRSVNRLNVLEGKRS